MRNSLFSHYLDPARVLRALQQIGLSFSGPVLSVDIFWLNVISEMSYAFEFFHFSIFSQMYGSEDRIQGRTASSNRPWQIRQTSPISTVA